jgi:taurine---2-oxoglutarate transaminase
MKPYFHTWVAQEGAKEIDVDSAAGAKIFLKQKQMLIDSTSTSYHVSFGHNETRITNAIAKQTTRLCTASPKFAYELKTAVSEELIDLINLPGKIFYTLSGAESVENALKMARHLTKRQVVAARSQSYHGASLGALMVTGDWRNQAVWCPTDWTLRIPECFEDIDGTKTIQTLEEYGASKVAAIILETVTGNNGVYIPTKEYLKNVSHFAKQNGIMFILDEVICGFYRCHEAFGFQNFGVEPDMLCLAKSITGGHLPFGAIWVKESIAAKFDHEILPCGLTNYAHPLGLAATQAVLDIVKEKSFVKNLHHLERDFLVEIKKLPAVKSFRQIGMLAVLEISFTPDFPLFLKHGLYGIGTKNRLLLAPNLLISNEELSELFNRVTNLLKDRS